MNKSMRALDAVAAALRSLAVVGGSLGSPRPRSSNEMKCEGACLGSALVVGLPQGVAY